VFDPAVKDRQKFLVRLLKPLFGLFTVVKSSGRKNIPKKGGFIFVSNHRSTMDPVVISTSFPRYVAWMGDDYAFNTPLIGLFLKQSGAIPVSNRPHSQRAAFRRVKEVLSAGEVVGIFPEGNKTIVKSLDHLDLGDFNPGFAEFALRFGAPILPIAILPYKEDYQAIMIPDFVRDLINMPKKVAETDKIIIYRKVHVHYGNMIDIKPYQEMVSNPRDKNEHRAIIQKIVNDVHELISETMRIHKENVKRHQRLLKSRLGN